MVVPERLSMWQMIIFNSSTLVNGVHWRSPRLIELYALACLFRPSVRRFAFTSQIVSLESAVVNIQRTAENWWQGLWAKSLIRPHFRSAVYMDQGRLL